MSPAVRSRPWWLRPAWVIAVWRHNRGERRQSVESNARYQQWVYQQWVNAQKFDRW